MVRFEADSSFDWFRSNFDRTDTDSKPDRGHSYSPLLGGMYIEYFVLFVLCLQVNWIIERVWVLEDLLYSKVFSLATMVLSRVSLKLNSNYSF